MDTSLLNIRERLRSQRTLTIPLTLLAFVTLVLAFLPSSVAADAVTSTGSMVAVRWAFTTTLLNDGRVLAAGGEGLDSELVSAELYDPTTGAWQLTGSMADARVGHTATLLPDGRVLVAGGTVGGAPARYLTSAELYDPQTERWQATGSMQVPHAFHQAVLLPDSRVLVVGGPDAELYDPATGSWSPANVLNPARVSVTATLLLDGRVLVAGGQLIRSDSVASAELYGPASDTSTLTGSMATVREVHTAARLTDGRVLVVGGAGDRGRDRQLDAGYLDSAEVYDPNTGTWSLTGRMSTGRLLHTATLLTDGRVLVVGGENSRDRLTAAAPLASVEGYDPVTGTWSVTGSLTTARDFHTATLLQDGRVLIAGGVSGTANRSGGLSSAELYDPTVLAFP